MKQSGSQMHSRMQQIHWVDVSEGGEQISTFIKSQLRQVGIVFIRNVRSEEYLTQLANNLGTILLPRHGNQEGVANIHFNPNLKGKGYTMKKLYLHTDRSSLAIPPKYLMTTIKVNPVSGGLSTFLDGKELHDFIENNDPEMLSLLKNPNMTLFKQDCGTFKPRAIFESLGNETAVRFRLDDSIAFNGDLLEKYTDFLDFVDRSTHVISFQPGEGYILDNSWWLHGRTEFEGSREILRILVNPIPKKLILFDIDGTLLNSHKVSVNSFFSCLSDILCQNVSLENVSSVDLNGRTDLNLVEEILNLQGVSEVRLPNLVSTFLKLHPIYLKAELDKPNNCNAECPGVLRLLKKIRMLPEIAIGLLTGNSQTNAYAKMQDVGIETDIFDTRLSAYGDSFRIRSQMLPKVWEMAKELNLDFDGSNTLIVGDTPRDIETARDNGAKVLAVATGGYSVQQLQELSPDFILPDMTNLDNVLNILANF